jgi:hypothetical protein
MNRVCKCYPFNIYITYENKRYNIKGKANIKIKDDKSYVDELWELDYNGTTTIEDEKLFVFTGIDVCMQILRGEKPISIKYELLNLIYPEIIKSYLGDQDVSGDLSQFHCRSGD